ncbi:hypothetical protein Ciccas_010895, partial [Cichlidogyrus casuarinus]
DLILHNDQCYSQERAVEFTKNLSKEQARPFHSVQNRPECIPSWREQNLTDSHFLPVEKMPDVFVYTAYLDERVADRLLVRVYVYKSITRRVDLFCHFLDELGHSVSIQESAKVSGYGRGLHKIREWQYVKWAGYMMTCTLPANGDHCSLFVSTSSETLTREQLQLRGAVQLPLRSTATVAKPKKRALCVRNLHSTQDLPLNLLVENIHYAFLSGVDIVVFYLSETPSNALASLISTFNELKLQDRRNNRSLDLRFVPWFLPKPEETFAFNQPLLTNDCMMRTMPEAVFIQFHDIDEILVPPTGSSAPFTSSIEAYFRDFPHQVAMCLYNIYFPPFHRNKTGFSLRLADSIHRCQMNDGVQSKCVIKPRKVIEMGVHEGCLSLDNRFIWSGTVDVQIYGAMHHLKLDPFNYCPAVDSPNLVEDLQHASLLPNSWRSDITKRLDMLLKRCKKIHINE